MASKVKGAARVGRVKAQRTSPELRAEFEAFGPDAQRDGLGRIELGDGDQPAAGPFRPEPRREPEERNDLRPNSFVIAVSITEQAGAFIRTLLYGGLYGTTEAEVAERLISEALAQHFPKAVR